MIEIFIKTPVNNPDLSFPESQKLPSEYIPEVWKKIQESDCTIKIETVSSAIVNFVGHCIYYKKIFPEKPIIHFEGKEYFFNSEGCLMDWPYGVLDSWFREFSHWQFPDESKPESKFYVNQIVIPTEGKWLGEQCKIVQIFPDISEAVIEMNVKSLLSSQEKISFDGLMTKEEVSHYSVNACIS